MIVMARARHFSGKLGHFLRAWGDTRISITASAGVHPIISNLVLALAGMMKWRLVPLQVKPHRISADKKPLSKAVRESSGIDGNSSLAESISLMPYAPKAASRIR